MRPAATADEGITNHTSVMSSETIEFLRILARGIYSFQSPAVACHEEFHSALEACLGWYFPRWESHATNKYYSEEWLWSGPNIHDLSTLKSNSCLDSGALNDVFIFTCLDEDDLVEDRLPMNWGCTSLLARTMPVPPAAQASWVPGLVNAAARIYFGLLGVQRGIKMEAGLAKALPGYAGWEGIPGGPKPIGISDIASYSLELEHSLFAGEPPIARHHSVDTLIGWKHGVINNVTETGTDCARLRSAMLLGHAVMQKSPIDAIPIYGRAVLLALNNNQHVLLHPITDTARACEALLHLSYQHVPVGAEGYYAQYAGMSAREENQALYDGDEWGDIDDDDDDDDWGDIDDD